MDRERMAALMREQSDRMTRDLLFGAQTTANNVAQEPLTYDKVHRMMLALPKSDELLSTKFAPPDSAFTVEGSDAKFTVAHPGFWLRVEHECKRDDPFAKPNLLGGSFAPFMGVPIREIDLSDDDSPERREYLLGIWRRLIDAITVASVPLPEWLRNAPKFGKHG